MAWSYSSLYLELLFTFKISRSASDFKNNFIVTYEQEGLKGRGECAPNLRYGETLDQVKAQLENLVTLAPVFEDLVQLNSFMREYGAFQSVKNAVETCYIDYLAQKAEVSIADFLKLEPTHTKATMFTLPIMDVGKYASFFEDFDIHNFEQIKIKVHKDTAVATVQEVSKLTGRRQLFIDANESFESLQEYLAFESALGHIPFGFVEQPFPSHMAEAYRTLKDVSLWPIVGDESVISHVDMASIAQQFHGINVKMMKAGGFLSSITLLDQAKSHGLFTMLGCMVETTLGIYHAFQMSALADYLDLDSFMYIKEEPFGLIRQSNGQLHLP